MSDRPAPIPAEKPDVPPVKRRKVHLVAGIVLLILVVAIVLPIVSTLQPAYYERYPDLRERMGNWRTSTHGRISCASCHVHPGASGVASFALRSIPAFYSQLITGPSDTNLLSAPDHTACRTCHTTYRQVSADGDLLIPHRAHVEILKIDCVVCHKELVHGINKQGFNRPTMRMCLETCHDGEQAGEECIKCHTRKHVPKDHLSADWLEIHAKKVDTIDCGGCHEWTPNYCEECHSKRPASHKGNWKTLHAERAKTKAAGCRVCHDETFCKECH